MKEERGQDLTEYALWTGVIALFLIAVGGLALYTDAVTAMAGGIEHHTVLAPAARPLWGRQQPPPQNTCQWT
jgi:Flp pilus assembly pilin Flp